MTHSKQAAKRVRQNNRARVQNRAVRSSVKSVFKQTLAGDTPQAREKLLRDAMSKADKAVKSGVIHKNQASRRKSRLMRALNKLAAAGAPK
jgi:small subunit ribosomal protein S20